MSLPKPVPSMSFSNSGSTLRASPLRSCRSSSLTRAGQPSDIRSIASAAPTRPGCRSAEYSTKPSLSTQPRCSSPTITPTACPRHPSQTGSPRSDWPARQQPWVSTSSITSCSQTTATAQSSRPTAPPSSGVGRCAGIGVADPAVRHPIPTWRHDPSGHDQLEGFFARHVDLSQILSRNQ